MASFGSVPLVAASSPSAGAVLFTIDSWPDDRLVQIDGAEVQFQAKEKAVIARGVAGTSHTDVKAKAIDLCNNALDLIAMTGGPRVGLAEVEKTNIVWWIEQGRWTVRLSATSTIYMSLAATVEVRDKNGVIVQQQVSPPPPWHESMRYFRMSQTTDDLYDAFRNTYLALESILSSVEPVLVNVTGRPEGEGVWVTRAITTAGSLVNLGSYLRGGGAASTDPAGDVVAELYGTVRSSIFHAKNGRPVLLPQDQTHRPLVADALERYTRLYVDLVNAHLGVTFPSGGMTSVGFEAMTAGPRAAMTLVVSDDPTPVSKSDVSIAPSGGRVAPLTTSGRPDLRRPLYDAIYGVADIASVACAVGAVSRFGALLPDGQLGEVELLAQPLDVKGFDLLECVMAVRGVNAQQPRSVYET